MTQCFLFHQILAEKMWWINERVWVQFIIREIINKKYLMILLVEANNIIMQNWNHVWWVFCVDIQTVLSKTTTY